MLKAKDVMIQDVYSVPANATIQEVLNTFAEKGISGAPIVDSQNQLTGYISDGDIMRQLGRHQDPTRGYVGWAKAIGYYYGVDFSEDAQQRELDEFKRNFQQLLKQSVQFIGTRKAITVEENDSLVNVSELLAHKNIKKVPVVRGKTIVGIISRGDIVRFVVQRFLKAQP